MMRLKILVILFIWLWAISLLDSRAYAESDDISIYGMHIPKKSYLTELKPNYDSDVKTIDKVLAKNTIRIPFQIHSNNLFYLKGEIDGHPVSLLFDTGAVIAGIDSGLAKELGYGQLVKWRSLTLGAFERHNLYASTGNFRTLNGCDAVIGPSVFDGWVITINMENHELEISKDVPKGQRGLRIPFQRTQSLVQVAGSLVTFPATLDKKAVTMCLGTGAGHSAASSTLFGPIPGISSVTSWISGKFSGRDRNVSELNLGHELLFNKVNLQVIDNWSHNDLGKNTKVNAILGSPILNRVQRLIIDYPHSQLIFEL
jgi:hypothetical protein